MSLLVRTTKSVRRGSAAASPGRASSIRRRSRSRATNKHISSHSNGPNGFRRTSSLATPGRQRHWILFARVTSTLRVPCHFAGTAKLSTTVLNNPVPQLVTSPVVVAVMVPERWATTDQAIRPAEKPSQSTEWVDICGYKRVSQRGWRRRLP